MPRRRNSSRDPLGMFAQRKERLRTKAGELAATCGVDVVVLCTGPDGGGETEFWPSKARAKEVAQRYRLLPPEERGAHTEDCAVSVERELKEEGEKLGRVRKGGIAAAVGSLGGSLEGMALEALQELLASIDASVVAARGRVQKQQQQQPPPPPRHAAADHARVAPGIVHLDEVAPERSVSVSSKGATRPLPRGDPNAGGHGRGLPLAKNPKSPNAAPVEAEEVVAENSVTGEEDASDEVQILQPPGHANANADADADDAEWIRDLVDSLKKKPLPCNAAPFDAGIERINVGRYVLERDAYDFIRFDLGMPPPCIGLEAPDSPDDDGEPLKLWSWDNTMPPPK
ncbi:hypothetical protein ACP70R_038862 [Stipagrostis hirtigluma subsp. patula]